MSITLKVQIQGDTPSETVTRTFRFPATISVHDANQQIREKLLDGGNDRMLFLLTNPPTPVSEKDKKKKKKKSKKGEEEEEKMDLRGIWMRQNRLLDSYDVGGDDVVLFRKRHVVIKVKTADESTKAVVVDLAQPVKDTLQAIGTKFGLERTDEYALQWEGTDTWLKVNKPLTEQGDPNDVIVLKKRFYITDTELDKDSPVQLHLAYVQGREMIVSGLHPTTKDEAAMFAALQAQVEHGIFNPHTHKPGFLDLPHFLPPQYVKVKDMENNVLHCWKSLGTMTSLDAKYKYHQLCMTLRTYGTTIYAVTHNEKNKKGKVVAVPQMLGFTATHIQVMSEDCKVVLKEFVYGHLRKWNFNDKEIVLDFGEFNSDGPMTFSTTQGADISSLISGYVDILVRNQKSLGEELKERGDIAELQSVGQAHGRVAVGMTMSRASGLSVGMQNISNITDLNSFQQAFQSYQVPTLHQLNASAATTSLTFEQLSNQVQSNGVTLTRLAAQMQAAALAHNGQELSDLSKHMGMVVTNVLQDAQRAAIVAKEAVHKQRILDACHTSLNGLARYTEALKAYEADPCDANKSKLDLATLNLENSVEAVLAAMRNIEPDSDTGSLLLELAKNVGLSVGELCAMGEDDDAKKPELVKATAVIQHAAAEMLETVEVLGQYACDPAVRTRMAERIAKLEPCTAELVSLTAEMGCAATAAEAQTLVVEDVHALEAMLDNTHTDIDSSMLPYLRAVHTVLDESNRIVAQPDDISAAIESAKLIREAMPVLLARAKELCQESADGSNSRMLEYAQRAAFAAKALVEESAKPADQCDAAALKSHAETLHLAAKGLLGEDELTMHKAVLFDRSKMAASSLLRVGQLARSKKRTNPDLVGAAQNADRAVRALLEAMRATVGSEGDDRVNVGNLSAVAAQFVKDAEAQTIAVLREADPESAELCDIASADIQALEEETQQYQVVGRLADIEYAVEPFRAAEAALQAIIYANEAEKFSCEESRDEVVKTLAPAAAQFGAALREIAEAAKEGKPSTEALGSLSAATQKVIRVAAGLVAKSRFKHERTLLVDAGRQLALDVNKLIAALQAAAKDGNSSESRDAILDTIGITVASLQKIIALAQQEGGKLQLDSGDVGDGPKFDAELEAQAEEVLNQTRDEIESQVALLQDVGAALESDEAGDPKSTVNSAIVESITALVQSTSAVVGAASSAQNELVVNLRNIATRASYARNPALARGLIDAARHLLSSINDLTRGLNTDTIATLSQEELASHAENVSKAVELLVAATQAGIKAHSDTLFNAAHTVTDATRALVEAAKMIEDTPAEGSGVDYDPEDFGIDSYTMEEIKIQMRIAELEHQLERARKKYDTLLKVKPGEDNSAWNESK